MNHYRTSDGIKVTKVYIDRQVTKAKKQKIDNMLSEHGYVFCEEEGCGINANSGVYIDCSHDISVDQCQKNGKSELAWDINNITMRCRPHHMKHD